MAICALLCLLINVADNPYSMQVFVEYVYKSYIFNEVFLKIKFEIILLATVILG